MRLERPQGLSRIRKVALPGNSIAIANRVLCRILIVDDNADLAESMAMILSICGFNTTTAYNGRLALEKAHKFRPEIVLLDLGLPDMNGYEVASTIRRKCGLATPIFIAMSAADPDLRAPHAQEDAFDHYLVKPVDLDGLLWLLSNHNPSHGSP
jgi:CheY-like chemotaxis protein